MHWIEAQHVNTHRSLMGQIRLASSIVVAIVFLGIGIVALSLKDQEPIKKGE